MIKTLLKRLLAIALLLAVVCGAAVLSINGHVKRQAEDAIASAVTEEHYEFTKEEKQALNDFDGDCILVLGAGIKDDETPTPMLKDRLDAGILLYKAGIAPKILLTGDNGSVGHNEIHVMLKYVREAGVPEEDIFCDHAGFSTYDSLYRAQDIFRAERLIVVTQTYHQYRALYIGQKLGMEVMGVSADQEEYAGQSARDAREILARVKDYFKLMGRPEALLGGEVIPISGSGIATHGE